MLDNEPPQEFSNKIMQFLQSSVSIIHQTQNAESYFQWVKENYQSYLLGIDESLPIALLMARQVWNNMPLSSNRYRPSPLPEINRNSRCSCGSGKKYKQCCLPLDNMFPPMQPEEMWVVLAQEMSQQEIEEALALNAIPVETMSYIADSHRENGRFDDACQILEAIFTTSPEKMGAAECNALNQLCNIYDDFGLPQLRTRKLELLHKLKDKGSRLIRSEAWQRISVVTIDEGDIKGAWKAFQKAQRLTPNDPSIDLLELNLLLGESKAELAQQRAKMMIRKKIKEGRFQNSPSDDFIQSVADDPQAVIESLFGMPEFYLLNRLENWLEKVKGRRLPVYKIDTFDTDYHLFAQQKIKTGAMPVDIFAEPESENDPFNNLPEKDLRLITPKSIEKLEKKWFEQINYESNAFPWDDNQWAEFLESNPQSFGSIQIIKDILDGLKEWEQDDELLEKISLPLAQRVWQIYESLPEQVGVPWGFLENRVFYSALTEIIGIYNKLGEEDKAIDYTERLIAMNPNDNMGLRDQLANQYLAKKAYYKVFNLVSLYPKDVFMGINMAKVLALWATGEINNAKKLWQKIQKNNPHIKKYMYKSKISAPECEPYRITMGGEDEAWIYRESARDIWLAHKGAISWLNQN